MVCTSWSPPVSAPKDDYEEKWSEKYLLQAASLRGTDEDGEDGKDKDSGQMNPMMAMMMNPMMAMMMNPMMQMNPMMMGARPMMMPGCGCCGGCPGCGPGMPPVGANGAPGGAQSPEDAGTNGPDAASPGAPTGAPSQGSAPGATLPGRGSWLLPAPFAKRISLLQVAVAACRDACLPAAGRACQARLHHNSDRNGYKANEINVFAMLTSHSVLV